MSKMSKQQAKLEQAIREGNLDGVQRILSERDDNGRPIVNINDDFPCETALHCALFAMDDTYKVTKFTQRRKEEQNKIFQYIIDLRDFAGNPIADLNRFHRNAGTVLSQAVLIGRKDLVGLILGVYDAEGKPCVDLVHTAKGLGDFFHPLVRALYKNNLEITRYLVDYRRGDGYPVLTREHLKKALATAREHHTDQEAILWLAQELQKSEPSSSPVISEEKEVKEEEKLAHRRQNTHDPHVRITATRSLIALNKIYPSVDEAKVFDEINALLDTFEYKALGDRSVADKTKKDNAMRFLKYLEERESYSHSQSGLSFKRIVALIWAGVNDDRVEFLAPDVQTKDVKARVTVDPSIMSLKRASLVEKFIEASLTYRDLDICDTGAVHQLVAVLDHAHVAVNLCTEAQSVKPAAIAVALLIPQQEFPKLTVLQQRGILRTWLDDGESNAANFKRGLVAIANQKLVDTFDTLLDEKHRTDITSAFGDLPCPVVHPQLDALIKEIEDLPDAKDVDEQFGLKALKARAANAYRDCDLSFEEEYQQLRQAQHYFTKLKQLVTEILAVPNDDANPHRQQGIEKLQRLARESSRIEDGDFVQTFMKLNVQFSLFKVLDQQIKTIDDLTDESKILERAAALRRLRAHANNQYSMECNQERVDDLTLLNHDFQMLDRLADQIAQIPHPLGELTPQVAKLKRQAAQAYKQPLTDLEKTVTDLQQQHDNFIALFSATVGKIPEGDEQIDEKTKIETVKQEIIAVKAPHIRNLKGRVKVAKTVEEREKVFSHYADFCELEHLTNQIMDLPVEVKEKTDKNTVIQDLQKSIVKCYCESTTFSAVYTQLKQELNSSKQLDQWISAIDLMQDIAAEAKDEMILGGLVKLRDQASVVLNSEHLNLAQKYSACSNASTHFFTQLIDGITQQRATPPELKLYDDSREAAFSKLQGLIPAEATITVTVESAGALVTLLQAQHNFQRLENVTKRLANIRSKYSGDTPARVAAINKIDQAIRKAYTSYAKNPKDNQIIWVLVKEVNAIKEEVRADHNQHGSLRFLGSWSPQSSLVKEIDLALGQISSAQIKVSGSPARVPGSARETELQPIQDRELQPIGISVRR